MTIDIDIALVARKSMLILFILISQERRKREEEDRKRLEEETKRKKEEARRNRAQVMRALLDCAKFRWQDNLDRQYCQLNRANL